MKLTFFFFFFSSIIFGQQKPTVFYNEIGEEINYHQFIDTKNSRINIALYFENDSIQRAILVTRQKFGQLDKKTFTHLKAYLTELSGKQIDSTQNIVINYLTVFPKKEKHQPSKSGWTVLHRDYLRKLHKIANINQFWIHSPECDNLKYYHQNKINWIADKDDLFKKLFFLYDFKYGNYILIKPDGQFYYYLGEHGKDGIWRQSKKYFN